MHITIKMVIWLSSPFTIMVANIHMVYICAYGCSWLVVWLLIVIKAYKRYVHSISSATRLLWKRLASGNRGAGGMTKTNHKTFFLCIWITVGSYVGYLFCILSIAISFWFGKDCMYSVHPWMQYIVGCTKWNFCPGCKPIGMSLLRRHGKLCGLAMPSSVLEVFFPSIQDVEGFGGRAFYICLYRTRL